MKRILFLLLFLPCFTQASSLVPTTTEPGQLERRFEQEPGLLEDLEFDIPEAGEGAVPENARDIKFILREVNLRGNTAFTSDELSQYYYPYIGKEITLEMVYYIAQMITHHYRSRGYILSQAIVPAQRVKDGIVEIDIIEGYIDNVSVEGCFLGCEKLLNKMIAKITECRPLKASKLERYLLLINELPGTDVAATIHPSTSNPGAANLLLTACHIHGDVRLTTDNRGTKYVGPYQFLPELNSYSFFGFSEHISFRAITVNEPAQLRYGDLRYEQPICKEGTRFIVDASLSRSKPGDSLSELRIKGRNFVFSTEVNHPFIRSRKENLRASANFTCRDSRTQALGEILNEDKIRTLNVGCLYDRLHRSASLTTAGLNVTQGLDIFGNTGPGELRSRENGHSLFTKINADLAHTHQIGCGFSILASGTGQYSFQPLLAAEKFGVGGGSYGRAYDPSEITGDHGLGMKGEVQWSHYFGCNWFQNLMIYGFYDVGIIWQKERLDDERIRETLEATGVGTNIVLNDCINMDFQASLPVTRKVAAKIKNGNSFRYFFNINLKKEF